MRNNDRFEKTSDFLDLMSRSERKAWERAQKEKGETLDENKTEKVDEDMNQNNSRQAKYKLKQEENEVKEILKDNKPLKPIGKEQIENTQSIKAVEEEELQVGELGKTQHFLNLTSELTTALETNIEENLFEEKKKVSKFNPITWIGLLIILCFGYFIYLVISSGYDEELLLLIDSGFLLGIIFFFGLSIVSNKNWTKVFSIFNFLLILAFVGINIFFLYNWNNSKKQEKDSEPIIKEEKEKNLSCTSDNLNIEVIAKNNYITKLKRTMNFEDEEELNSILKIFENQEGIAYDINDKQLAITFDFENLDINEYKNVMRNYLEYYRDSSDFTYIEENKLLYDHYKESELKELECTEKEGL